MAERPRVPVNVNFPAFKAGKRPVTLKLVFSTCKITNVMEYITFFDFAAYRTLIEPRIDHAADLG